MYYSMPVVEFDVRQVFPLDWPALKLTSLIMHTLSYAITHKFQTVYCGASHDDTQTRPEVSLTHLKAIQALLHNVQPDFDMFGLALPKVVFEVPLILLNEEHVIRLGNEYGTPWSLSWCCDLAGEKHCGVCYKCKRRQRAFIREGSLDPTDYVKRAFSLTVLARC